MSVWERLVQGSSPDPDRARRHRLLNIILVSLAGGCGAIAILVVILSATTDGDFGYVLWIISLAIPVFIGLYFLARYISSHVASALMLVAFVGLLMLGDTPLALSHGRSTIYFVLPIIMASMLITPRASFIVAGLVIAIHAGITLDLKLVPNILTATFYLIVAMVSWLTTSSLERALTQLRVINRELDQRVVERTCELSEALQREQAEAGRNRSILQSIADSVLVFDPQGRLTLANPHFCRLIGRPLADILGQSLASLLENGLPPQQQKMILDLANMPNPNAPIQIDYGKKILILSLAPVLLESGASIGSVAVLRDATQEVQLSRMKNTFLAMASHELRTPVSVIFGMTEILQQKLFGPLNDKQQEVLTRMMGNIQKLMGLVKDLLDHTKLEAGMMVIRQEAFSPQELISSLQETTQSKAAAKGLGLVMQIEPDLPTVLSGDAQRLYQVVENLVTNAIKFTETGQIRVRFYRFDPAHWAIEVRDTGPGIDAEARARIFEPFWQVDSSMGREHGGVGLGLAIVQRLVNLMDGELRLESTVGTGSTFTGIFPLWQPKEPPQLSHPQPEAAVLDDHGRNDNE